MEEELYGFSRKNLKNYDVIETDVLKYFHRPAKSKFHYKDVVFENDKESTVYFSEQHEKTENEDSLKINKCTQTDYRESEAQTEPWDPPFTVVKHNQDPKVLLLKEFSYGNGLPVTKLELDYIIQTFKNQNLMNELEKNNDNSVIKKEEIISNQVETKWDYKIKTEALLQCKKLNEMKASVVKELKKNFEKKEQILQNMWNRKKSEINIQSVKFKEKLNKELHSIENQYPVKENYSETSNVFGGRREKNINHNIYNTKFSKEAMDNALSKHFLSNEKGISSIKELLEKKETVLKNEIPLPRLARRTEREKLAEEAYQNILFKNRTKLPPKVYHEEYEKTETPLPSVKPDDVEEYLEEKESKVDMATIWQQILRGLAYQKQMLELIERHKSGLSSSLSDTLS